MWGGTINDTNLYLLNITENTWEVLETTGNPPSSRSSFPYFMENEYFYILPGLNFQQSDVAFGCFRISLITLVWESVECALDRFVLSFAKYGNSVILLGGVSETMQYNELVIGAIGSTMVFTVLSPNWIFPDPRLKHSLIRSRQYLWLFGGYSQGILYFLYSFNDSWRFDLILQVWEQLQPAQFVPSARCCHAYSRGLGDTVMIFGGENQNGYLNDFFIFNLLTNEWVEIISNSLPSPRAAACMYFQFPILYIYGGINEFGIHDDLWFYDFRTSKLSPVTFGGEQPPPLYGHQCFIDADYNFLIVGGNTLNNAANPSVYLYNSFTQLWSIIFQSSLFELSNFSMIPMSSSFLIIGGNRLYVGSDLILQIFMNGTIELVGFLEFPVTYQAAAYSGKSIYLFGGAFAMGTNIIQNIGINDFYNITSTSFDCSPGNYGENCDFCSPGTYSEYSSSPICTPCNPGTYSNGFGQDFLSQCIPCSNGTFSDQPGSTYCKDCETTYDCPIGSSELRSSSSFPTIVSVQPPNYDNKDSNAAHYTDMFYVAIGALTLVLVAFFFAFRNSHILLAMDIFKDLHPRKYFEDPYPTQFGGLVSMLFVMAVLILVVSPIILYNVSNITETKTLVPAFTLENQVFSSEFMALEINLYNYAGECGINGTCLEFISLHMAGFVYETVSGPYCNSYKDSCSISLTCTNCYFEDASSFNVTFAGYLLYTSGIQVHLSCSTSLPDYNTSSIQFYIESPADEVFNGLVPSLFYVLMIPTVMCK